MLYPGSGTADGAEGCHVLFAPPFIASDAEIDEMLVRIDRTLEDCFSEMERAAACARG